MKFKIRYADQIVGLFIILALVSLIIVIVLLGRSQRWFARDISFSTNMTSATGLGKNMTVQYKGFTIGNVKDFYLTDTDDVHVVFLIHDEYRNRVRQGSLVEIQVSPIGLGNAFLFHAGKGDLLAEGSFIPVAGSAQAMELIRQGLAVEPQYDDSISLLMGRINSTLDDVNQILALVDEALGSGSDQTEVGKIVGSLQKTLAGVEVLPDTVDQTIASLVDMIEGLLAEINPLLASATALIDELNDPDGLVYSVLDTDKDIYGGLVKSLTSISSMLNNLDRTVAFLPGQVPGLLMELRTTLKTADDALVGLTNNPLLRGGIPEKVEGQNSATSPRDIRF